MPTHKDDSSRRSGRRHPVLTPLTLSQADRLVRLATDALSARGLSMRYDGAGGLVPLEDRAPVVGLANLARTVGGLPRQQWRAAVAAHFDQMPPAGERPAVPEDLENELFLRLVCAATIDPTYAEQVPEFLPGLVTVPATYLGRAVAMHFDLDSLGEPWAELARMGLANLRRLKDTVEYVQPEDEPGPEVAMLTGSMFTASRALVLDTVLRESLHVENPPYGCLVAMPARDIMLVHVLRDDTVIGAFCMLATLANHFFSDSPGPVSPHVYYVTDNQWEQVTDFTTGTTQLRSGGRFSNALRRLDSTTSST